MLNFNLTKFERQLLINQLRILGGDTQNAYINRHIEILQNGYINHYDEVVGVFEELPLEDSTEVANTLQLFTDLQSSYNVLPPSDQQSINTNDIMFSGYSGNEETTLMGYAQFCLSNPFRGVGSTGTGTHGCNSHVPMRGAYLRMKSKAKQFKFPFNVAEIQAIVASRAYPQP